MSVVTENRGKRLFSGFRDTAVFLGWAAALFLAGFLLWSLTQSLRDRSLLRAVNRVFIQRGETRRLGASVPPPRSRRKTNLPGSWYSLAETKQLVYVFSVMNGGVMAPYAAFIGPGGKVSEVIPLSVHAEQFTPRFREGLMGIYIRRIEKLAGTEEET